MDPIVDFRSDTLTQPCEAMRDAMARALVGDDVFGEDPTVNRLEEKVAVLLGKEKSLFVPSGTMANLLAVLTHTRPGDEVILGAGTHPFNYESGGASALAGVQLHPLVEDGACYTPEQLDGRVRPPDPHFAPVSLAMIENTHNRGGGRIVDLERVHSIQAVARKHGLALHLDGARLMNAVVATGIPADQWSQGFDSVSTCFSKGLGAPVGSVLAGPASFIHRARRFRKMLGGGMRQAGILAAAAIYALDNNVTRLADDHSRAKKLVQTLQKIDNVVVDEAQTNIVIFTLSDPIPEASVILSRLKKRGVLALAVAPRTIRLVVHLNVDEHQIDHAGSVLKESIAGLPS